MCVVSPLVIVAPVTAAPGMYHYYVCFVCSITVFCSSSKLTFCASVHCVLLSLIHMLPRHFVVYLCCCYRPFVSVAFTGMKVWSVLGWWCDLSVHLLQQTMPHKETDPLLHLNQNSKIFICTQIHTTKSNHHENKR